MAVYARLTLKTNILIGSYAIGIQFVAALVIIVVLIVTTAAVVESSTKPKRRLPK
jgi:hypothetical protein